MSRSPQTVAVRPGSLPAATERPRLRHSLRHRPEPLGYALIGAGWLIKKTDGELRDRSYKQALWLLSGLVLFLVVGAVAAFWSVQVLRVHLHGLWAALTAIIVTEASAGRSITASLQYVLGPLAGAVYASFIALLVPRTTLLATAGAGAPSRHTRRVGQESLPR